MSRGRHGCGGGPWNAVDDGRLVPGRAGAGLDGLQRCQSDCVETRSRKDPTQGTDVFVVVGGYQVSATEDEANPKRPKFGRPPDEGEAMARDRSTDPRSRRTHEYESGLPIGLTNGRGDKMKPLWLRTS